MLMVAPSGKQKAVVLLETPEPFSTHSIVKGNVPDELAVEKAVNIAGAIER